MLKTFSLYLFIVKAVALVVILSVCHYEGFFHRFNVFRNITMHIA